MLQLLRLISQNIDLSSTFNHDDTNIETKSYKWCELLSIENF